MQTEVIYVELTDPQKKNPPTYSWHLVWDAATFLITISSRYLKEKESRHVRQISEADYYRARWPEKYKAAMP